MKNETKCPECGMEGVSQFPNNLPCCSNNRAIISIDMSGEQRVDGYRFFQSKICATIQALKKENEELKREFMNMRDWCHEDSDWFKHMDAFIEKKECQLNCNFCYTNTTKADS